MAATTTTPCSLLVQPVNSAEYWDDLYDRSEDLEPTSPWSPSFRSPSPGGDRTIDLRPDPA